MPLVYQARCAAQSPGWGNPSIGERFSAAFLAIEPATALA